MTYEQTDAADFASWGVDYLKYADCNGLGISAQQRFTTMRDALNKTGKNIYYSLSKTDPIDVSTYGPATANSWRTSGKVRNGGWENVRAAFLLNNDKALVSGPGGWNDPDLLDIGTGDLTLTEEKTQFALWALAKAPLLISCELASLTSQQLSIVKNKNLIAVNQDPSSSQATCIFGCGNSATLYGAPQLVKSVSQQNYYAAVVVNWSDLYT